MKGSEGTLEMEMWSSLTASVAKNTKSFGEFWFLSPSLCIFHSIKIHFPILRKNLEGAEFLWLIMVVIHLGPPGGLNLGSGDP